jgi:hypothetical protein
MNACPFEGNVGEPRQLAELHVFVVQDLEHTGARGLFGDKFSAESASGGSDYHFGFEGRRC